MHEGELFLSDPEVEADILVTDPTVLKNVMDALEAAHERFPDVCPFPTNDVRASLAQDPRATRALLRSGAGGMDMMLWGVTEPRNEMVFGATWCAVDKVDNRLRDFDCYHAGPCYARADMREGLVVDSVVGSAYRMDADLASFSAWDDVATRLPRDTQITGSGMVYSHHQTRGCGFMCYTPIIRDSNDWRNFLALPQYQRGISFQASTMGSPSSLRTQVVGGVPLKTKMPNIPVVKPAPRIKEVMREYYREGFLEEFRAALAKAAKGTIDRGRT